MNIENLRKITQESKFKIEEEYKQKEIIERENCKLLIEQQQRQAELIISNIPSICEGYAKKGLNSARIIKLKIGDCEFIVSSEKVIKNPVLKLVWFYLSSEGLNPYIETIHTDYGYTSEDYISCKW